MRVGTRIKELCAALEGVGSATAAEIHRAAFPELDVNAVRTYCSRAVGLGFATVGRGTYPMRFTIAEGWAKFKAKTPAPAKQRPAHQPTVAKAIARAPALHTIWMN